MALRGNLKDFSLPDVFQLVTFSRKTGVLRIVREDEATGAVWFRDGDVFFASSDWHSELLGERLVRAQRITEQALARALQIRMAEAPQGRRLGEILVEEGYITHKVLEAFVSEQIQDTIFDLMRWDEGEFDFEAMPEVVEEDIGLSVSMENVVMEGSRRLEEWNRIRKKIPSTDVIFKMATAPGEGTFEISLKPIEWQLLLLIDGTRAVSDLAVETGRTDFEVARIVYGLFSAGLLEFATDEEIEQARGIREEREARRAEAAARAAEKRAEQEAERRFVERHAAARSTQVQAPPEADRAGDVTSPRDTESYSPSEVPEFLGGAMLAPTADDQAVLEQFMGAVLKQAPVEEPETPAAGPAPQMEPHVPAEEPAFMSAAAAEELQGSGVAVTSVEELLGIEAVAPQEPAQESLSAEQGLATEQSADIDSAAFELPEPTDRPPAVAVETLPAELLLGPAAEPEPAPEPAPEPEIAVALEPAVEPEPDFERDLMALGLGELPTQPTEPVPAEHIPATEPPAEVVPASVAEPMSAFPEIEGVTEPSQDQTVAELAEGTQPAIEASPSVTPETEHLTPDFSELLESLDVDEAGDAGAAEAAARVSVESDFDSSVLDDDESVEGPAQVISTDAFIEDIRIGDLGLSGGLNDEISALTGAERRQSRPQASVSALPDAGSPVLQRDSRVDRETLLKIIDGISNL